MNQKMINGVIKIETQNVGMINFFAITNQESTINV